MITFDRPICFLDLETTSVDVLTAKIIEMSVVKWFPDGKEREVKTYRFNPGVPIPAGASEVHGITDEMVKDCPKFKNMVPSFIKYLDGCDIGGFNSNRYDLPIILREVKDAGYELDVKDRRLIDVGNIYKINEPRTLSKGVEYYLGRSHDGAHGAEADTIATVEIFEKQIQMYFNDEDKVLTVDELDEYCNFGKKRLDLAGKFEYKEDGQTVTFSFGSHKGENVLMNYGFLQWMLSKDFTPDTKAWCKYFLDKIPFK